MSQILSDLHGDWRVRKQAISRFAVEPPERRAASADHLVELVATESLDLGVLNGALQSLVALGKAALGRLDPLLEHPLSEVRQAAAVVLGQLEAPLGVRPLLALLKDPNDNVRYHAIEGLGQQRAWQALSELLEVSRASDTFLAFAAVEALARIGDRDALPTLIELLRDPLLASSAAEALGRIGDSDAVVPLLTTLTECEDPATWSAALEALAKTGVDFPTELSLEEKELLSRYQATTVLDRVCGVDIGSLSSTQQKQLAEHSTRPETLQALLGHEDDEVRLRVAIKLQCQPVLLELLPTFPEQILPELADPKAVPALLLLLRRGPALLRRQVVQAGIKLGPPDSAWLSDAQAEVRGSVAYWLIMRGELSGEELLSWFRGEPEERARTQALDATSDPELLKWVLESGSASEQALAIRNLPRVEAAVGMALLESVPPRSDLWCSIYLCRALRSWKQGSDRLQSLIVDPRPPVRAEAVRALAAADPGRAQQRLPVLLNDESPEVARVALTCLAEIGAWKEVRSALKVPELYNTAVSALAGSPHSIDLDIALQDVGQNFDDLLANPAARTALLDRIGELNFERRRALLEQS